MLDEYSVKELRYAFENWNRNGRWFPKPKDISDQVEAYKLSKKQSFYKSDIAPQQLGRGYGEKDMVWLYNRYLELHKTKPNRPMTDGEINSLLDELDCKRGESPAWRRSA